MKEKIIPKTAQKKKRRNDSGSLTVVGHLEELRKRIIVCVVAFLGFMAFFLTVPSFADSYSARIMKLLQAYIFAGLKSSGTLNLVFLDPLEPVLTVLKLTTILVLLILAPLFSYQVYAYLKPALSVKKRSHTGLLFVGAALFFIVGALLSFYLLIPMSFNILINYGLSTGSNPVLSMGKFFDMLIWMFLLFTLPFELPVLIGVLSKVGVVTVKLLSKIRKPAYLLLAIFSAAVTPDPTPFSMIILWGLLVILFEFGVLLSYLFERGAK